MPKNNNSINAGDDHIDCEKTTDLELEEWIVTTRKVLLILRDENKDAYDKVFHTFVFDLQRLKDARRITDIDYENILESL